MDLIKDIYLIYRIASDIITKIIPWWRKNILIVLVLILGVFALIGAPFRSNEKNQTWIIAFMVFLFMSLLYKHYQNKKITN